MLLKNFKRINFRNVCQVVNKIMHIRPLFHIRQKETRKPGFLTDFIEFSDSTDTRNMNVLIAYQILDRRINRSDF